MRDPGALTELLQTRLKKVEVPENHASLRKRLMENKPARELPLIHESPENLAPIEPLNLIRVPHCAESD